MPKVIIPILSKKWKSSFSEDLLLWVRVPKIVNSIEHPLNMAILENNPYLAKLTKFNKVVSNSWTTKKEMKSFISGISNYFPQIFICATLKYLQFIKKVFGIMELWKYWKWSSGNTIKCSVDKWFQRSLPNIWQI